MFMLTTTMRQKHPPLRVRLIEKECRLFERLIEQADAALAEDRLNEGEFDPTPELRSNRTWNFLL